MTQTISAQERVIATIQIQLDTMMDERSLQSDIHKQQVQRLVYYMVVLRLSDYIVVLRLPDYIVVLRLPVYIVVLRLPVYTVLGLQTQNKQNLNLDVTESSAAFTTN